jgi:hypothetical protein
MNSWRQAMKQWAEWLMGDGPLPGGRSKVMLVGAVATAAVIAVGVPAAIPSSTSANVASKLPHASGHATSSSPSTVAPASLTVAPPATVAAGVPTATVATATTTVRGTPGANSPLAKGKIRLHDRVKATARSHGKVATLVLPSTNPLPPTAPVSVPSGSGYVPASVAATAPAPLAPMDPLASLVARAIPPPAPLATGAASLVASALVTWKAPVGSATTGYSVFAGFAPGLEFPVALNGANPVVGTSYLVSGLTAGKTYYFTVRARVSGASSTASNEVMAMPFSSYTPQSQLIGPIISMASTADGTGYWLATGTGAVSAHGSATDLGNTALRTLAAPIVEIVADPRGAGYWEVAADGGIFAYGSAHFEGAAASRAPISPIVGMVPTADGLGYWEVAADGGVFAYGDAAFAGSLGATRQIVPTVGMAADAATGGYWLVSADGTATAFNAPTLAQSPTTLPIAPVVGVAATADGKGLWEVTRAGNVYAYGDAGFQGPTAALDPNAPIQTVTSDPATGGYWLTGADGGIYAYGAGFFGAG